MTPQEVLTLLNDVEFADKYQGNDNHTDMLLMCKSALEKQIPKNPNIHGLREGREINTISFTCPNCNEHIGRDNFCKHCGQALDWSDTE